MNARSVLILGGSGYIGSALAAFLQNTGFDVARVDNGLRPAQAGSALPPRDYRDLTAGELAQYGGIVLLAGHSSVGACDRDPPAAFANNVAGFAGLVHKLRGQKLIFASSSSVYVRTAGRPASEAEPLPEPATHYDLHKQMIEAYARVAYTERSYALRLGTVCGPSPNVRRDVLLNALVWSALTRGEIEVANRGTHRPLLGIHDLGRAVAALLERPAAPGAYNLASVNAIIGEVADHVAGRFGVPCRAVERPTLYDMAVSTAKFTAATGVRFTDTIPGLVEELAASLPDVPRTPT